VCVCVCGLEVHFVSQRAIRSPLNIEVQEGQMVFAFSFLSEFNGFMGAVRWC
jgi:hypothetical protein